MQKIVDYRKKHLLYEQACEHITPKVLLDILEKYFAIEKWFNALSEENQKYVLNLVERNWLYLIVREKVVWMQINVNDLFYPAADAEIIEPPDLKNLNQLFSEFEDDGIVAYICARRNADPMPRYKTPNNFSDMLSKAEVLWNQVKDKMTISEEERR